MKHSITYTVFSVVNLIAFLIVTACIPGQVAVGLNGGLVDRLGSPWQFLALPSLSVLLSVALFVIDLRMKKGKYAMEAITVFVGALFVCAGWAFLGIAAQGAAFGERVYFPYATVTALPLSMILLILGYLLPFAEPIGPLSIFAPQKATWGRHARIGRVIFMAAGTLTAVVSVIFACNFKAEYDYVAIAVVAAAVAISVAGMALYSRAK